MCPRPYCLRKNTNQLVQSCAKNFMRVCMGAYKLFLGVRDFRRRTSSNVSLTHRARHTPISAAKFPKWVLFTNRFRWNFAEVPWIKKSDVPAEFFRICPTSGFMGNFRFKLVFQISRYKIDQSKLTIAQIEALNRLKSFYFASLELG